MRTTKILPSTAFAALLVLTVRPAFADAAVRPPPYRRPVQLQQPIAPTVTAHLEAAKGALQTALAAMKSFDSLDFTLNYGGYFARARADTDTALTAFSEAIAFVAAHPENNALDSGPAQLGDSKAASLLPSLPPTIADSPEAKAVDALNVALAALVNRPAIRDDSIPVPVNSAGGGASLVNPPSVGRAKLIAAVVQIGTDLGNGLTYYKNVRGGRTGIIPLSAPTGLLPDPKFGPTARTYLAKVQKLLDNLSKTLAATYPNRLDDDPTQGGYVPKATADLQRASEHLVAALAWLDTHPEAVALKPGPAGPEPSDVRRDRRGLPLATAGNRGVVALWPIRKQGANSVRRLNEDTIRSLNDILGWLLNDSDSGYRGPVLGDLGGYRGKIMDDLGQAFADTHAAFDYVLGDGPAAEATPKPEPGASPATP